jgi:hypothetical protein
MAIEIREVVIRATVTKSLASSKNELVTKSELQKSQDRMASRIMSKVKELLEERRAFR